jgi:ABC-type transport system substrate-binding protein
VTWSDGTPFTSADVLFSFQAIYDPKVQSLLASSLKINGKPLVVTAPDPRTVVVTLPGTFGPGIALLDNVYSRRSTNTRRRSRPAPSRRRWRGDAAGPISCRSAPSS